MEFLYSFGVQLYGLAIRLASPFNNKAKKWVAGRSNWESSLQKSIDPKGGYNWVHCASLGEFEQGRTIIESIKMKDPKALVLLSFFSPSGYEIRKNYAFADVVTYLPIDSKENAEKFIQLIKPIKAIFIKYEFWYHYLSVLDKNLVPTYLVSGIFRENQLFFKPYGTWWRRMLKFYTHLFIQDENSARLLKSIGILNYSVSGDTRFDRVLQIEREKKKISLVENFKADSPIFIAGSTWSRDEELIVRYIRSEPENLKFIIAPHEIEQSKIDQLVATIGEEKAIRYSKASSDNIQKKKVLIIDNIGLLASLYQYGTIGYIGGGFGKGIHNILEAATFGMPLIFGPNYKKFKEAIELIKLDAAFAIDDFESFKRITNQFLEDEVLLKRTSSNSRHYVTKNAGATEIIIKNT